MHKLLFIIGLLVFVTPVLGLPSMLEKVVIIAYGISIMLVTSTIKLVDFEKNGSKMFGSKKDNQTFSEIKPEHADEPRVEPIEGEVLPDFNGQVEEIIEEHKIEEEEGEIEILNEEEKN